MSFVIIGILLIPFDVCLTDYDEIRENTGLNFDDNGCRIHDPWDLDDVCDFVFYLDIDCQFPSTKTLWENIKSALNLQ